MTKRIALLIGSETFGLNGCHNDVHLLASVLQPLGFEHRILIEQDASREGLINAFHDLADGARADDAVLIYYSGHGLIARRLEDDANTRFFQSLVPYDMDQPTETCFKGVLDVELSRLMALLTRNTRNAVMIMDCCHSARMCRDPSARPRSLDAHWTRAVAAHLRQIEAEPGMNLRHVESNPDVVRLAAAGRHQCAYEYKSSVYGSIGFFTEALVEALKDAIQEDVCWADLGRRIRERVLFLNPIQRPEIEGPVQRGLFQTQERQRTGVLTFFYEANGFEPIPKLRGGRLAGVCEGNVYGLMPPGAQGYDAARSPGQVDVRYAVHPIDFMFHPG